LGKQLVGKQNLVMGGEWRKHLIAEAGDYPKLPVSCDIDRDGIIEIIPILPMKFL